MIYEQSLPLHKTVIEKISLQKYEYILSLRNHFRDSTGLGTCLFQDCRQVQYHRQTQRAFVALEHSSPWRRDNIPDRRAGLGSCGAVRGIRR